MSADARRVVVSLNPKAGRTAAGPRVELLAAELARQGFEPEVVTDLSALTDRAVVLHNSGELRCVVASGGDGTVAELANRLPEGIPLAVFPLGTENLLGRHLGYRRADVAAVCETLKSGVGWRLDAGEVTWLDGSSPPRLFLLMLSCGFDADVVHRLHKWRKSHISHLSYFRPLFSSLRHFDYPPLSVTQLDAEGEPQAELPELRDALSWIFVFNLPCYAGGLQIAPQALATDGVLNWCGFRRSGAWSVVRYGLATLLHRHANLPDAACGVIKGFRLESDRAVPLQIDGDAGGFTPIEVRVLEKRFSLLTPRSWNSALTRS